MSEEVASYFCRYATKNIPKLFKNPMKIKNWTVVAEKFKEDEHKRMVARLGTSYVKMEVFISESSVEKAFCDWAVDWIFFFI